MEVNVTATAENTLIVTQKKHDALAPLPVGIQGNIHAPAEYFAKRKNAIADKKDSTHVLVNLAENTVLLVVDEENPYNAHKIKGSLLINPEFTAWGINTDTTLAKKGMIDLIKPRRFHFANKEKHASLLISFQNFAGKVEKTFEDSNDFKGNKKKLEEYSATFKTYAADGSLEGRFDNKFTLELPIFVGFPKVTFDVELCLDPTDMGLKFFLQSLDLYEKMAVAQEAAIKEAIAPFMDYCPVIFV